MNDETATLTCSKCEYTVTLPLKDIELARQLLSYHEWKHHGGKE